MEIMNGRTVLKQVLTVIWNERVDWIHLAQERGK